LQQLGSAVEQTGTPAPDRLAEIEADERARVEGLQKLLASQAQVDPRIVAARREAAELAQRGIGEREKRAAGALEAAGMPLSQSLLDNQEALFRMLGAMKGGKRIGDAFSSIGQEAGAIRGEQRRALELVQRDNRAEQNALDQLRQAQADLKLAQTTGDVQGERNAALKVEEAKANLGLTRLNIQKERATEADRKTQRAIEEKRIATTVSEGALDRASRERLAKAAQTGDSRRVFDTLMDNARAEFDAWAKSPEGASSVLKPGVREAKRAEFLEKQVALAKAAGVQGLDPLLAAVKAQSGAGAARGTRENPIKLD
jgi:NADH dehydrogenase/NADH:ubiquinone oxidoreductase subunit G